MKLTATAIPTIFDLTSAHPATEPTNVEVVWWPSTLRSTTNTPLLGVGSTADQSWFWHSAWQEGELEATADAAAGRTVQFMSGDDFLSALQDIASHNLAPH